MDWVHACSFCGWSRPAAGPTMMAPRCERCGCVLEALSAAEHASARTASAGAPAPTRHHARLTRALTLLVLLAPAGAAARLGFEHGGAGLAVLAGVLCLIVLAGLGHRTP